jgi:hypothetical protein
VIFTDNSLDGETVSVKGCFNDAAVLFSTEKERPLYGIGYGI